MLMFKTFTNTQMSKKLAMYHNQDLSAI